MLEQMRFSNASIPVTTVLNDINTVNFGGLDLQPSYQRGYIWKDDFKDKLGIDEKGNPIGFDGEGQFDFSNGQNVAGNINDKTLFFMQDKVNNFSGVSDYTI